MSRKCVCQAGGRPSIRSDALAWPTLASFARVALLLACSDPVGGLPLASFLSLVYLSRALRSNLPLANSFPFIHLIIYLDRDGTLMVTFSLIVSHHSRRCVPWHRIPLSFHSRPSRHPKSRQIISFADPHPLTLLQSHRSKNTGGGGPSLSRHPERSALFVRFLHPGRSTGALRMHLRSDRPVPTLSGRFRPCRKGSAFSLLPYFVASLRRYVNPPKG